MRQKARQLFREDIREGNFVKEWSTEQAEGSTELEKLMEQALQHPLSQCEKSVIEAVQAAKSATESQ